MTTFNRKAAFGLATVSRAGACLAAAPAWRLWPGPAESHLAPLGG